MFGPLRRGDFRAGIGLLRHGVCTKAVSTKVSLQRVWRRVHPDLFQQHPHAQATNQRSMQELNAFLDAASRGATISESPPSQSNLQFFVRDEDKEGELREVSLQWWSPSPTLPGYAGRWTRSADKCVATLLSLIERRDPTSMMSDSDGVVAPRLPRSPYKPGIPRSETLVRAAQATAERTNQPTGAGEDDKHFGTRSAHAAGEANAADEATRTEEDHSGRYTLREELLFFFDVEEKDRQVAAERLRLLLPQVTICAVGRMC